MNSVTEESGPVNIDRPRPAISHEVPGRVERRGPVMPPVGLEGARAPCGGVAFADGRTPRRPHVMHVLDDEPHAPHVAHAEHAGGTLARRRANPRQRKHSVPGPASPHHEGPTVVWPACPSPVAVRRRSRHSTPRPRPRAAAAVGPWRQPRRPPRGGRGPSPSRAGTAYRAPALPRAQSRRGHGRPPAAEIARPTAAVPPPRPGRTD